MSYRWAVRRLVVQSQQQQARRNYFLDRTLGNSPSSGLWRPALPQISRANQDEGQTEGGGSSEWSKWDENLRDHLTRLKFMSFADVGKCSSLIDRSEESAVGIGSNVAEQTGQVVRAGGVTGCDFEGRVMEPARISNEISSAQIAMLGCSGKASSQSFGRSGGFHGVGRGPMTRVGSEKVRFYSSTAPAVGENLQINSGEQLDALAGVADTASTVASVATTSGTRVISEVAAAAADCSYPTAAIQYVIEGVHLTTGLPWWASIAATTVAIRILVLPILVYQMKATARLTLMRPELEKLTNHIKENNYDPKVVEENQMRMKLLFQQHKTSPLSPILGAFVQAPIFMCFFFAIRNMAERVESFKEGGALWFTDLSTPDSFFIMPVLSGAMFLLTVELGATDGMQGQPMLGKMKMALRGLAVLLVPLTASFPKALFCYWLTANVCSIVQAAIFKQPGVKGSLGIPDVSHMAKPEGPIAPVMTFSQPPRPQSTISKSQGGEGRVGTYVNKKRRT
ncbi:YidC/Oxa1 family membrane protein insertase [Marchantia polymorpha subsp. ruderalis]|uniref:Membrane insertase YidC/Oxa/ALB C-terminal domain-containing protein n=2 Tax=Marchantia polymorpha TaxID=3197 RepID=A0A176WPY2_MARPO|nr:hypothetical protein AXG93_1054s1420 [Marchantia polymorpha subsp. ruderalis]PTQ41906.1 hypothetical protein MARPO_0032s0093 [Marchantia polymorpha]BBN11692.1 hypothetical protein Mp_5g14030 [Marchantia polymorpha subsp. ruderalis]|eukprot:PTQ41906.1 hypothetical protein MARPO_0032s0093 [Marchantia polymorpha]